MTGTRHRTPQSCLRPVSRSSHASIRQVHDNSGRWPLRFPVHQGIPRDPLQRRPYGACLFRDSVVFLADGTDNERLPGHQPEGTARPSPSRRRSPWFSIRAMTSGLEAFRKTACESHKVGNIAVQESPSDYRPEREVPGSIFTATVTMDGMDWPACACLYADEALGVLDRIQSVEEHTCGG